MSPYVTSCLAFSSLHEPTYSGTCTYFCTYKIIAVFGYISPHYPISSVPRWKFGLRKFYHPASWFAPCRVVSCRVQNSNRQTHLLHNPATYSVQCLFKNLSSVVSLQFWEKACFSVVYQFGKIFGKQLSSEHHEYRTYMCEACSIRTYASTPYNRLHWVLYRQLL